MNKDPMEPEVVFVAPTLGAAQVVQAKLESYGIRAALLYESAARVLGLTGPGWGETRVIVPAEQAEEARALLAESDVEGEDATSECP